MIYNSRKYKHQIGLGRIRIEELPSGTLEELLHLSILSDAFWNFSPLPREQPPPGRGSLSLIMPFLYQALSQREKSCFLVSHHNCMCPDYLGWLKY